MCTARIISFSNDASVPAWCAGDVINVELDLEDSPVPCKMVQARLIQCDDGVYGSRIQVADVCRNVLSMCHTSCASSVSAFDDCIS